MTTITQSTVQASALTLTTARRRPRAAVVLGYLGRSLARQLSNWPFMVFVIAMPTAMYLMFSAMWGDKVLDNGTTLGAILMTMMATYGGLSAAMHAGNAIQAERSTGWLRQLQLTPLRPAEYLAVKVAVAVAVVIPAIGIIYAVAAARGVHLSPEGWGRSLGLLLVALVPMIILGIVIGIWFNAEAANPATTMTMLAMSMLGGLWFDIAAMPQVMQDIAHVLPSYWANQFAQWPVTGGDFPTQGLWVLAAWTLGLCALGLLGYRRAARASGR